MKIGSILVLLLGLSFNCFSQKYMDEIVQKACECTDAAADSVSKEMYQMELGICIINAAAPYKKQLKKEYKIDFNKIEEDGEELGRIIGIKMASVCPGSLMKMVGKVNDEEDSDEDAEILNDVSVGTVIDIAENTFVVFSLKDDEGKVTKYYWFTFIESEIELSSNYKKLLDKSLRITSIEQEFFDPRISEYRKFKVILKLEELSE